MYMPRRCSKGTRRNKKTGLCEKKTTLAKKKNTLKQWSSPKLSLAKLSSAKKEETLSAKKEETLSANEVDMIIADYKVSLEKKHIDQDIMKSELMKLTYNKNYRTGFTDEPPENLYWMADNMVAYFLKSCNRGEVFNVEQMLSQGIYS